MSTASSSKTGRKIVIGTMVVVAVSVGGYFAKAALFGPSAKRDLSSGDSKRVVDALSKIDNEKFAAKGNEEIREHALATLKEAPIDEIFDRLRSDELPEEERERLEDNLRALMMEDMTRRVNEYHDASEDQKTAILDQHLDEMMAFRDKMRAYREKHSDDSDDDKEREHRRGRRGPPSKEARKKWMEGRNPDRMARMMQYWPKMMARAKERGIEFGRGHRGH